MGTSDTEIIASWLVFQHRDADKLLHNIVSFLGIFEKHYTHKLIRIGLNTAHIFALCLGGALASCWRGLLSLLFREC